MIAVITVSNFHYEKYLKEKSLRNLYNAKQVSILKDIQGESFTSMVEIEESTNVTNFVINKTRENVEKK